MRAVRVAVLYGFYDHIVEGTDGKLYYVRNDGCVHEIFSLEFYPRRIERVAHLYIDHDYVGVEGRNGYFMLRGTYNGWPVFIVEVPGYRIVRFDNSIIDYNVEKQCAFCGVSGGCKGYVIVGNTRHYAIGRVMCFNADRCIYAAADNDVIIIADALTNEVKRVLPGTIADYQTVIYPVSEQYCIRLRTDTVDLLRDGELIEHITVTGVDRFSIVNSRDDSCVVHGYRGKSLYIDFSRESPIVVFSLYSIYRLTKKGIFCQGGQWYTIFIDNDELRAADRKCLLTVVVDLVKFPVYRSVVYIPTEISS